MEDRMVLCCSNSYEKKFYLSQDFQALPQHIKDELKIMFGVGGDDLPMNFLIIIDAERQLVRLLSLLPL